MSIPFYPFNSLLLRLCLFESKIGWMEKFGEKIGRNFFLSVFGWVGRKKNKWWDLSVFFSGPPKSFLSKMERKLKGENKVA